MKVTKSYIEGLIKEELKRVLSEQIGTDEDYMQHGIEVFEHNGKKFGIKKDSDFGKAELFYIDPDTGVPNFVGLIEPNEDIPSKLDNMMQQGAFQP